MVAYTPPPGNMLALSWQAGPHPLGWDSAEFGTAEVKRAIRYLYAGGFTSADVPAPLVKLYTRYVTAPAIGSTLVYGTPYLYNRNKQLTIYPFTGQPITPPSPKVYNLLQLLRPGGIASPFVAGTLRISNYLRYLTAGWLSPTRSARLKLSPGVGTSPTSTSRRRLPVSVPRSSRGRPRGLSGGARRRCVRHTAGQGELLPRRAGVAAGLWYSAGEGDRTQRFYPFNWDSSLYGTGFAYLLKQEIRPAGILQWEFEDDRFGYYTDLFNKIKKITTNGYDSSRFSIAGLVYNARGACPCGRRSP